ncbi:MAG TPA: ComEC/Rec2 family competence protein [Candidatus Omnitrophota bacterium]|nr:ComEC/Rec2 family competence protein [Candidatus Omnitrophota bacterium]
MKHALVVLAVCFCAGIAAQAWLRIPLWVTYGLFIASIAGCRAAMSRRRAFAGCSLAAVALSGAVLLSVHDILPADHIAKARCYLHSAMCVIQGVIVREPQMRGSRTVLMLRVQEIRTAHLIRKCSGSVQVYLTGETRVGYGDLVQVCGRLGRPVFAAGPRQQAGFREYVRREGLYRVLYVRCGGRVKRLAGFHGRRIVLLALRLKRRMSALLEVRVSPIAAGMLQAMILGEKRAVPASLYRQMIKTGTVHILVVSGFNVGIVAFILVLVLRLMRIPRSLRFGCVAPLLVLYCLITGASPPVVRATIMAVFFLFALLVQREPDILNSCAMAALSILTMNPRELFNPSFQLSFSSVLAIICLHPRMKILFKADKVRLLPCRFLLENSLISLSAWLGTAGFIAYYFRMISPVAVLANILIPSLAGLITVCGFGLLAAEIACPYLAPCFGSVSECICVCLLKINALLLRIPRGCFYLQ